MGFLTSIRRRHRRGVVAELWPVGLLSGPGVVELFSRCMEVHVQRTLAALRRLCRCNSSPLRPPPSKNPPRHASSTPTPGERRPPPGTRMIKKGCPRPPKTPSWAAARGNEINDEIFFNISQFVDDDALIGFLPERLLPVNITHM